MTSRLHDASIRQEIRESKSIPEGAKDIILEQISTGMNSVRGMSGSIELAWRRGFHSGTVEALIDPEGAFQMIVDFNDSESLKRIAEARKKAARKKKTRAS